jgi:uncharacterized protein YrrD
MNFAEGTVSDVVFNLKNGAFICRKGKVDSRHKSHVPLCDVVIAKQPRMMGTKR